MENLAIIPARSGSKGLEDKNIRLLNGKPLMAYTIEAALSSGMFKKVIVSTDSEKYKRVALEFGALVPYLRPKYLATGSSKIIDAILHVINFYEKHNEYFSTICLLQPTSPLRNSTNIIDSYKLFKSKKSDSVVSVCEVDHNPLWCNTINDDLCIENFLSHNILNKNRQELPKYYRLNGAIYISNPDVLKKYRSFYTRKSFAYIMDLESSVDIDSELDFLFAEFLLANRNKKIFVKHLI